MRRPRSADDTKYDCYKRAGTTEQLWHEVVEKNIQGVKIRSHPETDQFLIDSCCDILKLYKPDLLMIHTGDVDHYRHKHGLFNEYVTAGVEDTFRCFKDLIEATKQAGTFEQTNFLLISERGLIEINEDGTMKDWKRPIAAPLDITDYRFGRATHGHNPDLGPQPVFFGISPDIKEGVVLERRETVYEAHLPTQRYSESKCPGQTKKP